MKQEWICFSLFWVCVGMFILGAYYGHSLDSFTNSIVGSGSGEQRTNINGAMDVMSFNGNVVYKLTATWTDGTTPLDFESSVSMETTGKHNGMPYTNRYSVALYSSRDGKLHKLEATGIKGNFTGSASFVITDISLDSVIVMDSRTGNATFDGKLINTRGAKHPITTSEVSLIGNLIIQQEYNMSVDPAPTDPEDFCSSLNVDVLKVDPTLGGIYTAPKDTKDYLFNVTPDGMVERTPR